MGSKEGLREAAWEQIPPLQGRLGEVTIKKTDK